MNKAVLHIGFPKTGSTWFSAKYYPAAGNIQYFDPGGYLHGIARPGFEINKSQSSKISVLQHPELTGISRFVWDGNFSRSRIIAENLKRNFPDSTVVVFIRNQIDFLASAYIYYVKRGGTYKPGDIFEKIVSKKIEFDLNFLNYSDLIGLYYEVFGKTNVNIYLFEDFKSNPETFVKRFTDKYGFQVDTAALDYTPMNEKLRTGLMKLLLFTNRFTKPANPFKKYYINIELIYNLLNNNCDKLNKCRIFGKKVNTSSLFTNEQVEYFKDYFKTSNKVLIETYGLGDIVRYGYPV